MRLLTYDEDGDITITSFDDKYIPPYAILSHTWGADNNEVTFADIESGVGGHKHGYEKIRFCRDQARKDGLQYCWIDTCCIDKTNKAELSHAIRSMFCWYRNATRCYVYLSDVRTKKRKVEDGINYSGWERTFESSRWFTRGWTLQELIAPRVVEFFSQEGDKLGDKSSLRCLINKITSIPTETLDGAPTSQFSFEERLRWKGDRETKREEDAWYSMSGIFGVELAPAYSEGAASAFRRLKDEFDKTAKCTQDLHCTTPYDDKKRIEATKGGLLVDSYRWVLDNEAFRRWQQDSTSRLLWVKGDPGKGKTMLLCGIIDELQKSMSTSALLSYFFCQATDSRINSATAVLRGLLYMLVHQQPSLTSHIRKKYDQTGKALFEDANAWTALTEIFGAVLQDPTLSKACLIIDALDECITDLPKLLGFIAQHSNASSCVKWIVSSRNLPDIEAKLEQARHKAKLSLELNAESIAMAVRIFIQQKVDQLAQEKKYQEELRLAVLEHLKSNANDTFLWVALACQELAKTSKRHVLKKLTLFPPGLDDLYARMMEQISQSDDAETCRSVLACTAILYRPVTTAELIPLVEQLDEFADDLDSVREIISLCGSFLTLREDTVYFVHQSAKDFLLKPAYDKIFPRGDKDVHQAMFSKSLAIMSRSLHRDMYNLTSSDGIAALGFPVQSIKMPDPDPLITLRYPCVYWIDHLCKSESEFGLDNVNNRKGKERLIRFFKEKYLYWLEGLSLCNSVERGIVSMTKFWTAVQVCSQLLGYFKCEFIC
jgi:hypothetical protein